MAAVSTYLANKVIDHIRGVTSYTMPTVYMALTTTTSSAGTPGTETTYTNYARVALSGTLGAASSASGTNTSAITFPACGVTGATIVGWATYDASSAGNMLEFGTLTYTASNGNTPSFAASTFITTLT
jgi:hypothetical protein